MRKIRFWAVRALVGDRTFVKSDGELDGDCWWDYVQLTRRMLRAPDERARLVVRESLLDIINEPPSTNE